MVFGGALSHSESRAGRAPPANQNTTRRAGDEIHEVR